MNQSQVIKLIKITEFLRKNITQRRAVMTRIFDINVKRLAFFLRRDEKKDDEKKHEEHNKILKSHHEDAIHNYI
jgi:hypothetical protein